MKISLMMTVFISLCAIVYGESFSVTSNGTEAFVVVYSQNAEEVSYVDVPDLVFNVINTALRVLKDGQMIAITVQYEGYTYWMIGVVGGYEPIYRTKWE